MSSRHTITTEIEVKFSFPGLAAGEYETAYPTVEIEYQFSKGCPEVRYQRNGDPGWPAEPPEVEILKAKLIDGDGLNPTDEQLYDWADQWLDSEKGFELACENAAPTDDDGPDPDAAYEAERDGRMERD